MGMYTTIGFTQVKMTGFLANVAHSVGGILPATNGYCTMTVEQTEEVIAGLKQAIVGQRDFDATLEDIYADSNLSRVIPIICALQSWVDHMSMEETLDDCLMFC